MEHNEQLINIINQLNSKDTNLAPVLKKDMSDKSGLLKNYLSKFKSFKEKINHKLDIEEETIKELEDINSLEEKNNHDFERYSKSDSRVFTNKAKKTETNLTGTRWKQYSNTKAILSSDSQMAPLRLAQYNSDK